MALLWATRISALLLTTMVLATAVVRLTTVAASAVLRWRRMCGAPLKVDIHPSGVLLGTIVQTEFLAYLFDPGFDFLDMIDRMDPFSDNPRHPMSEMCIRRSIPQTAQGNLHMQMRLALRLRIPDTLLYDVFCFVRELPM